MAKYVELPVEDLRTRVQFPPSPPTKQKAHPYGGLFVLIATRWKLNPRPVRTQGGGRQTNSSCVLFVARSGICLQANVRPARQQGIRAAPLRGLRTTTRMQARWLVRMVTSEHCSRGTPGKHNARRSRRDEVVADATRRPSNSRRERSSPTQINSGN
jgi:hypothetical protein